jgi:hypothetical protein
LEHAFGHAQCIRDKTTRHCVQHCQHEYFWRLRKTSRKFIFWQAALWLRGMNTKLTSLVTAPYNFLARICVGVLGCIAVLWGITGFSVYWQDSSIERIATRIIAGDPYKFETLTQLIPVLDSIEKSAYCRPIALRSAAVIRLRMEEVAAARNDLQHQHLNSVDSVIRSSLSCAPADPFLWLALYSVEVTKNGFKPDYLRYLRLSYRLGPQEGWIVLKRNPLAFRAFQQLSPDLREDVVNEFFAMLHDGHFSNQAGEILIGPAWPERALILSRLTRLNDNDRRRFADELRRRGYDMNVPGIGLAPVDSHRFAPLIRVPQ